MDIRVTPIGLPQAIAALRDARPKLWRAWAQVLYRQGARMIEHGIRTYRSAGETTPTSTAVRTGALRRAYSHEVTPTPRALELALGVIKPSQRNKVLAYAAIHEFGGVVKPKNAQFLAIPLAAAKTGRGVARGTPRSFPNTFFSPGPFGGLFLMQRVASGRKGAGNILPLFLMRRKPVRIPERPVLKPTLEKFQPDIERDLLDSAVDLVTR